METSNSNFVILIWSDAMLVLISIACLSIIVVLKMKMKPYFMHSDFDGYYFEV